MNRRDFLKSIMALTGAAALRVPISRKATERNAYKVYRWKKVYDFSEVADYEQSLLDLRQYGKTIFVGLGDDARDSNDGLSPDCPTTIAGAVSKCSAHEAIITFYT